MAAWKRLGVGITDVTDVATDVEIVAPPEVRDFVAACGGRLYVWISVHRGFPCTLCLLETALKHPPESRGLYFRRIRVAEGFDLFLEATQRIWPRTMEFALRRRRVYAYWNGLAWIS
jgi:hypothetical protein